ncbi:MAG: tRNA-intron lyase [Nanoarchaeota archaeon]|jgi:tRNA-intron endonuclease|nr:tRNA-intron lyase [Nanoarchaeota archaeon]
MITINLIGNTPKSNDPKAYTLEKTSHFGKKEGDTVEFSLFETLYLLQTKKAKLESNSKELKSENAEKKFNKIDKKFEIKYSVYKDLRAKGYIPKTALKFGAEFRIYEKGKGPGKGHSKWIVFTDSENNSNSWHDFAAKNRVAHSTGKKLLLAIVDDEKDVSYYEVGWTRI